MPSFDGSQWSFDREFTWPAMVRTIHRTENLDFATTFWKPTMLRGVRKSG
jgi:hypothetical protein